MAVLEYYAKHNMIAYLEKIEENAQFHEIVDFLSRSLIFYALTVSPDVCASFIEQFWKITTFKTINNISEINAKVSGKLVVITKASIRSDLLFNDADRIDCLTNEAIFENLALMGYEGDLTKITFQKALFSLQWKFLIHTIIHCLSSKRDHLLLTKSSLEHDTSQDPRVNLEGTGGNGGDMVNLPHDSPFLVGHTSNRAEGSLNLEELSALCTNLSNKVLALETIKDAQAKKILTLKARIKKLEKSYKPSISHHRAWGENAKSRPTKDDSAELKAELDKYIEYMDTEEAVNEERQSTVDIARPDARLNNNTAGPNVSTARKELSTAGPTTPLTTTTIFNDEEMTLIDTLIKFKDDKAKGVAFKDSEDTDRPARSILTLKPLLTIDPNDKGKGVLEEPEPIKKMTKSDFDATQFARDEEITRQLEVELQAKVERERQREEQASMNYIENLYDEVRARIDVDHELAVRLTHEEQEKFVPIRSEEDERRIRDMNKKVEEESSDKGVDNTKKRKAGSRMKRMSKRQKTDVDLEEEEKLKTFLEIDPDGEGIIDYEVMDKRFPIINWESKFYHYDRHEAKGIHYRIFKSDGSLRWIKAFSEMVTRVYILILGYGTEIHLLAERRLMNLEAIIEERRIFKCWFYHHTTNGHRFTMSNRHQEVPSPKANGFCKELASPKQTALGNDISNP
nr:hypothetical protein [Tanacetum cinerariifolium]